MVIKGSSPEYKEDINNYIFHYYIFIIFFINDSFIIFLSQLKLIYLYVKNIFLLYIIISLIDILSIKYINRLREKLIKLDCC